MLYTHTRSDWVDPRYPVTGPPFNWDTIDWAVVHYTAAIDLPDGDLMESLDDIPGYLLRIHLDYLNRISAALPNGYSIGYNAAVDWLGGTWELRGDTFKCAANSDPTDRVNSPADTGGDENSKTYAILMLVDGQDGATPLAAAAVRGLVGQVRERRPHAIVLGHRDIFATQCPGTGVYAQITAGVFDPDGDEPTPEPEPAPEPEPTPPQEDDVQSLIYIGRRESDGVLMVSNGVFWHRMRNDTEANGWRARIRAGLVVVHNVKNGTPLDLTVKGADFPDLDASWQLQMGVELGAAK